jgi:uncharacterized membrane protein YphA (DoxX/SURF4 family)
MTAATATITARPKILTIGLWTLQIVLAPQFLFGGVLKLAGVPVVVELFEQIGAGQWLRYFVGAAEVAGAIGLLIPLLSGLAALGLAALMAGATLVNVLVIDQSPAMPLAFLVVAAFLAWARRAQVGALRDKILR